MRADEIGDRGQPLSDLARPMIRRISGRPSVNIKDQADIDAEELQPRWALASPTPPK